jgi:hypothetical protein
MLARASPSTQRVMLMLMGRKFIKIMLNKLLYIKARVLPAPMIIAHNNLRPLTWHKVCKGFAITKNTPVLHLLEQLTKLPVWAFLLTQQAAGSLDERGFESISWAWFW